MPRSNPALPPAEHPDELARWGIATAVEGEHRKVVVMFARLDGLNELIAAARTREAFEALDKFVRAMVAAVAQFGGYLAGNDVGCTWVGRSVAPGEDAILNLAVRAPNDDFVERVHLVTFSINNPGDVDSTNQYQATAITVGAAQHHVRWMGMSDSKI